MRASRLVVGALLASLVGMASAQYYSGYTSPSRSSSSSYGYQAPKASPGYGYTNPSSTQVDGYARRDGSYVAPHARTSPNGLFEDNYSTKGNINPYTGQAGTRVSPYNSLDSYSPYRRR